MFKFTPEPGAARRPQYFAKACFARTQCSLRKVPLGSFLKGDELSLRILTRADASPGSTTGSGWADTLAQTAFKDFLVSLSPHSGAARIIELSLRGELAANVVGKYPIRLAGAAQPQWVSELGEIPVTVAAFSEIDLGPKKKLASILAWSIELSKRSDAEEIFRVMLSEDMAAGLDAALFSTAAGSASAHAGLLNGLTPIPSSTTTGRVAIEEDLGALASAVATGGSGSVVFIMAPQRLAQLRILAPEIAANSDIAPSAALAATRVVAVDPLAIITAVDDAPDILAGPHATLHMSDTALPIVSAAGTVADPIRDMWQSATTCFRCLFDMAWAPRRTGAVAYLDAVQW